MSGIKPHVLAVPFPAQGHLNPMVSLCRQIAKHGIKLTLVNAQTIHEKIVATAKLMFEESNIELASIPDGLNPDVDDPDNPLVLSGTLSKMMPETLPELIDRINSSNPNEKVSCVIADLGLGCVFNIAEMVGVEAVCFSTSSIASLALILHIPKLLQQGKLDGNGSLKEDGLISLSHEIPSWKNGELPWSVSNDLRTQTMIFNCVNSYQASKQAKWLLCNACYELEPGACDLYPNFLPVSPLHLRDKSCSDSSIMYHKEASCSSWLDDRPDGSVIYVSFGSSSIFSQQQLDELALGLELSGRAFLWVVRWDLVNGPRIVYPDGFLERVSQLGKILEWAPQNNILSHRAVGCFLSHCGWNSTLEGVSEGVPYLCWPYFADQAHNESYICDKWEIGLRIKCDGKGMRSRYEIKKKIDMLFSNNKFKKNALKLKEMCAKSVSEEGSSYEDMREIIDIMAFTILLHLIGFGLMLLYVFWVMFISCIFFAT